MDKIEEVKKILAKDEAMEAEFAWRRGEEIPDSPQNELKSETDRTDLDSVNKPESRLLSEKEMPE